jgi:hypothetical protein
MLDEGKTALFFLKAGNRGDKRRCKVEGRNNN